MSLRFFGVVARGTESALLRELEGFGIAGQAQPGGVSWEGDLEGAYRVVLWSRVASRVSMEVARGVASSADALYELGGAVPWEDVFRQGATFSIHAGGRRQDIGATRFLTLRLKDAIVDRLRERWGARPDVDPRNPDHRVHLLLAEEVVLSLELASGMHRRGYRSRGAEAPLRETLAAALLEMAGWSAEVPLVDPLCGSGTLVLEAALRAQDIAPGLLRGVEAFEALPHHDAALWARLREEATERRRPPGQAPLLLGRDVSGSAIAGARASARELGLAARFEEGALEEWRPDWADASPGLVVTNPPYGVRVGVERELIPLYQTLGDLLKQRFGGWTAWILAGSPTLAKSLGLRPERRDVVYNGALECRLLEVPLRAPGSGKGPGWRKPSPEAEMFANRLRKNERHLAKWAKRSDIDAYRVYDGEIPEFNVVVDRYAGRVRVEERAPPRSVDPSAADRRLKDVLLVVPEVLGVTPDDVVLRVRARRRAGEQDAPRSDRGERFLVQEGGLKFWVNLVDYLDTGLFLDDREHRRMLKERARGRRVLNLFAYTCTASVAAAAGGAAKVTSVDLSRTYLDWGADNFQVNELDPSKHRFVAGDVRRFLAEDTGRYDLVYCAPPTYSRSKRADELDLQRDHGALIDEVLRRLDDQGEVLFVAHGRDFELRTPPGVEATPLGDKACPTDFRKRRPHQSFRLRRR